MPYRWIAGSNSIHGTPPRAHLRTKESARKNPSGPSQKFRDAQIDYIRMYGDWKRTYAKAKAAATRLGAPHLRVVAMQGTLSMLRDLINLAQTNRAKVQLGERGLTQLDADLAGLRARYATIYAKWDFEELPPASQWTPERWQDFEDDLEGPILMWTRADCEEYWGIPFGAPPCQGPDLLLVFQTINGIGEAQMAQFDMTDPLQHPIGSIFAEAAIAFDTFAEGATGLVKEAAQALADGARQIATHTVEYLKDQGAKQALPWIGLAVVVAGGVGLYLATRKRMAA